MMFLDEAAFARHPLLTAVRVMRVTEQQDGPGRRRGTRLHKRVHPHQLCRCRAAGLLCTRWGCMAWNDAGGGRQPATAFSEWPAQGRQRPGRGQARDYGGDERHVGGADAIRHGYIEEGAAGTCGSAGTRVQPMRQVCWEEVRALMQKLSRMGCGGAR